MKAPLPIFTEFREAFAMALTAIRAHKLRSGLTLLGILIGVFSIVLVMTAIGALQGNIEKQMTQLGAQTFAVQKWPAIQIDDDDGAFEKYFRRKNIHLSDVYAVRERATLALHVAASGELDQGEVRSRFGHTNPDIALRAMSPETFATRNFEVADGRVLVESDLANRRHVAVLGADLAKKLFPHGSAVGDWVKFRGFKYVVVGVLESKGAIFGQSEDGFLAIPVTTAITLYGREAPIGLQVQAVDAASFNDTVDQVRGILRAIRKVKPGDEDDFEIVSNDSLITQFRSITFTIRAGAGVISAIAMVAAGIGIMNIMLVSVTERTKEIGIRRAIGAKRRNIMTQFILEAVALSEIGGITGVALGIVAGNAAAMALSTPVVFPWDWALIGLGVCSAVGIAFGAYPAWKAAHLDPIDSLRYE
jgi:putative ABC transport system permease protein